MEIDVLWLVMRWLHMLAGITIVGSTFYMRLALAPAADTLGEEDRARLLEALRSKWLLPLHLSVLFLLVSGLYNIVIIVQRYELPRYYHPLFGIKFLLALAIFYIAIMLGGRSKAAVRMRAKARFWLTVNVVLAVVLVCISGVLRMADKTAKPAETEVAVAIEARASR